MKQKNISFLSSRSLALPPPAVNITIITYLLLNVSLAFLMPLFPLLGLVGAVVINLVVLLFLRPRLAFPLYIVVAGPSVSLSLVSSGILSRLYIGDVLFALVVFIWVLQKVLPNRKSGQLLLRPLLLAPLTVLIIVGLISIINSRLFPDPNVPYSYPHSTVPITLVNLSEMALLIGLPVFLILVPGLVRTVRNVNWAIAAYLSIGSLYTLGTIFAGPLNLYSPKSILGYRRPQVFGSESSGLGTLILLFDCIIIGKALYATTAKTRILWGLLSVVFSVGVIMSFGRESWVGFFLAVIAMVGLRTKNWTVLLVVLLPMLLLLVPGVSDFFDPSKVYGSDRLKIWQDALAIWQRSPYFGIGAGNFQFFDRVYGTDKVGVAHNQYLSVMAEMGIQGLLCLLWIIIAVGVYVFKQFNAAKSNLSKSLCLSYIGFYVSLLFGGFFTGIFIPSAAAGGGTGPFVEASYRWLLLGLVISIPIWEQEAVDQEQKLPEPGNKSIQQAEQEIVSVSRNTL